MEFYDFWTQFYDYWTQLFPNVLMNLLEKDNEFESDLVRFYDKEMET